MSSNDNIEPQSKEATKPLLWTWLMSRSLENSLHLGPSEGVWATNDNRVRFGWGDAGQLTTFSFEDTQTWTSITSNENLEKARKKRTSFYFRIWDHNAAKSACDSNIAVLSSFGVTEQWRSPVDGRLDFEQEGQKRIGSHSLAISLPNIFSPKPDIDWQHSQYFAFPNTWGAEWGMNGCGVMTYKFFDDNLIESWGIVGDTAPTSTIRSVRYDKLSDTLITHWLRLANHEMQRHLIEATDPGNTDRMGWILFTIVNGMMEVEDLYVKPEFRRRKIATQLTKTAFSLRQWNLPIRFWIPYADVDTHDKQSDLANFFLGIADPFAIDRFPRRSALSLTLGRSNPRSETLTSQTKLFDLTTLPPKASYFFSSKENVNTYSKDHSDLIRKYNCTPEFLARSEKLVNKHKNILKRLS